MTRAEHSRMLVLTFGFKMARCSVLEMRRFEVGFSNFMKGPLWAVDWKIVAELGLFIYNGIIWSAFDVCSIVTNICNKLHSIYSADEAIHQEDYFCVSSADNKYLTPVVNVISDGDCFSNNGHSCSDRK
ncbi:hypothetical protein T01_6239 [Trichinella spiralis]|uniref:Uncharacterized protein n=1 Tax=Trichinella spiralis TaxID=6334 RepID=A0A0V1BDT5_TRISP|nr:hypothetical protein T01_6239 [Trichinella spiralis]